MGNEPNSAAQGPVIEHLISGQCEPDTFAGVQLRLFASESCGARGFSTGTATFEPGACLPYHTHGFSEAATVLEGEAEFAVQGRRYRLRPIDCIHLPADVAHTVINSSKTALTFHWAMASPVPSREWTEDTFSNSRDFLRRPNPGSPEYIARYLDMPRYELAPGTLFCDLFAGRFGAVGICGGYGEFNPDSSLPCHTHKFDESITIVRGEAVCEVKGRRYRLSGCDTAFVPRGRPHRFLNESSEPMAMIWVYAGSEPEREIVDARYCTDEFSWEPSYSEEIRDNR